jgi:hypothetical protein
MKTEKERLNQLSEKVIGAAIEVHRDLGPGLLESTYEASLMYELELQGFNLKRQLSLPIKFKDLEIEDAYRIDSLCPTLDLPPYVRKTSRASHQFPYGALD